MKWSRAVHHLEALAETCTDMLTRSSDIYRIQVRQLWTFGEMVGPATDVEWVPVALAIDLPAEEVPWLGEPVGTQHWANATRLNKNPFTPRWRSLRAPIWNHDIDRPVLFWDAENGIAEEAIAALRDGDGERVREAGPTEAQRRERVAAELAICLASVRACTATYTDKRWAPGKLTPLSDAMWLANVGYLDLLDAAGATEESSATEISNS
ncbi:MAG TPA: hypothetical protein VHX38_33555 [Pseudonocardiaceae bacterium]|nr:hypothetical protein [Pseudonocardiaceae bacterium]